MSATTSPSSPGEWGALTVKRRWTSPESELDDLIAKRHWAAALPAPLERQYADELKDAIRKRATA